MEYTNDLVCVMCARAGSVRFPGKNWADVCGVPMFVRALRRIRETGLFGHVVLSTNDCEVVRLAKEWLGDWEELYVLWRNEESINGPRSSYFKAVEWSLEKYEAWHGRSFKYLCIWEPCCIFVTVEWVLEAHERLVNVVPGAPMLEEYYGEVRGEHMAFPRFFRLSRVVARGVEYVMDCRNEIGLDVHNASQLEMVRYLVGQKDG